MRYLAFSKILIVLFTVACSGAEPADVLVRDGGVSTDAAVVRDAGPEPVDAGRVVDTAAFGVLVQRAQSDRRTFDVPAIGIAIVEDGRPTQAIGIGTSLRGGSVAVDGETLFSAGSISKPFIATAALEVVSEGKLDLDAPITTYFPNFGLAAPQDPNAVTTRHLLSHTSGYPTWLPQTAVDQTIPYQRPEGLGLYFEAHDGESLWVEPGTLWNYSNIGYSLAALIVERAAGVFWDDLVQTAVFDKLAMTSATFHPERSSNVRFASGHTLSGNREITVTSSQWGYSSIGSPNGGLWISPIELSRFAAFLVAPGEAHRAMQIPTSHTNDRYGLGLDVFEYRGLHVVGHAGAIPGFQAVVLAVPERGFGVAVMVNTDRYNVMSLATAAIDAFLEPTEPVPPPPDGPAAADLVGTYVDTYGFLGTLAVATSSGALTLRFEDLGEERPLQHFEGNTFFVRNAPQLPGIGQPVPTIVFEVWPDDAGRIAYFASRLGIAGR